jgi:hypothetical protein
MAPKLSPQQFVAKWRAVSLKERSASQSHFNDLCRLVGHDTPVEADPKGTSFTFEAGATKQSGGEGWADVWKLGFFAWEYKGKHKDLTAAYDQLLQYRESLLNPPLLVVSDMDRIVIHTNFTNTVKRKIVLTLDDLLDPHRLADLEAVFFDPQRLRSQQTTEQVTERAAAHFAELAALLRSYGQEPQDAARFLIQLLFCLFAEDIGLLPDHLFTRLVKGTVRRADSFQKQLSGLFQTMREGGLFGVEPIPHVDGDLFDDAEVLYLDTDGLAILSDVCNLDWSNIEPSVLGTLFERSLDPTKRSQLGAHYTSRQDIELIVEPVLMAPLRQRWADVQEQARDLMNKAEAASSSGVRTRHQNAAGALVLGFARELASIQVLDPACGSGNFLYVALRQLLDLWKQASELTFALGLPIPYPLEGDAPHPSQLHGIEINVYAHQLAQTTIWIGYLQWLRENGYGAPAEPILKPLDSIKRMDAVLDTSGAGDPVKPPWPAADVIIGNPPFLGDKKMRAELGDGYVDSLRALYADRIPGQSDLVCYWFERARELIAQGRVRRAGLLATQGIRGGANRTVLDRIKESGDIFWAQADRPWILEGAAVHVSMIGFDGGSEKERQLDGMPVEEINADLTSTVDLTQALVLAENSGLSFIGTQRTGPFDITAEQAAWMLAATGNPNGRPNSDVVKPWVNGADITGRRRGMYIIDFGCDTPLEVAAQYEAPFEHVLRVVKPTRQGSRPSSLEETWWLMARPRPAMRAALCGLARFVVTPMVSKHRVFVWLKVGTIPENLLVAIARDDDYFFGVLHSRLHELWARRVGTQLREAESGSRYTPTTTFETFPFPWPPGEEPGGVTPGSESDPRVQAVAAAARDLVAKRQAWLHPSGASPAELKRRTLTNLYNAAPTWLCLAHRQLDEAVLAAYGWPLSLAESSPEHDEEILRRLLALNMERANARA